jgi:DNA-directed RNA polymerase specialized sigma24 family protein
MAFTLRHLEQMELAAVADALGDSLATVKRRLGRVVPVVAARIERDPYLAAYARGRQS